MKRVCLVWSPWREEKLENGSSRIWLKDGRRVHLMLKIYEAWSRQKKWLLSPSDGSQTRSYCRSCDRRDLKQWREDLWDPKCCRTWIQATNMRQAESYITYRTQRDFRALKSDDNNFLRLENSSTRDQAAVTKNANKDKAMSLIRKRDRLLVSLLGPYVAQTRSQCPSKRDIHYHDLTIALIITMTNCCLIDYAQKWLL